MRRRIKLALTIRCPVPVPMARVVQHILVESFISIHHCMHYIRLQYHSHTGARPISNIIRLVEIDEVASETRTEFLRKLRRAMLVIEIRKGNGAAIVENGGRGRGRNLERINTRVTSDLKLVKFIVHARFDHGITGETHGVPSSREVLLQK